MPIVRLCEMADGQEADLFALLTAKDELTTRDGQPFFRVGFRDSGREVNFPIWNNSPWAADCRTSWTPGAFYKLRACFRQTNYGPQLEIRKIREVTDADTADGFDPAMCLPQSQFDPATMFDELMALAQQHIADEPLGRLVTALLDAHRPAWLVMPAAQRNHHAFVGGLLEHTLSVARTCVFLADKYAAYYADAQPPLDKGLVVAGGILHDVGKLRELEQQPQGAVYTPEGHLIGHMLQGRDMIREAAAENPIDAETLLRLEHLIIAHQRLPEWGSPKPPMTPEAMLVHYADDLDAKYHMIQNILRDDASEEAVTSPRNVLGQRVFRGLEGK